MPLLMVSLIAGHAPLPAGAAASSAALGGGIFVSPPAYRRWMITPPHWIAPTTLCRRRSSRCLFLQPFSSRSWPAACCPAWRQTCRWLHRSSSSGSNPVCRPWTQGGPWDLPVPPPPPPPVLMLPVPPLPQSPARLPKSRGALPDLHPPSPPVDRSLTAGHRPLPPHPCPSLCLQVGVFQHHDGAAAG